MRPIITPFELEMALTRKSWTGNYILDFSELLTSEEFGVNGVSFSDHEGESGEEEEEGEERPVYSSTTGKYRHPKRYVASSVTGTLNHPFRGRGGLMEKNERRFY